MWLKIGGSAATCEDGLDGGVEKGGEGLDFASKSFGESWLSVLGVFDGIEVAVVTFMKAKGDVEIKALYCRRLGGMKGM